MCPLKGWFNISEWEMWGRNLPIKAFWSSWICICYLMKSQLIPCCMLPTNKGHITRTFPLARGNIVFLPLWMKKKEAESHLGHQSIFIFRDYNSHGSTRAAAKIELSTAQWAYNKESMKKWFEEVWQRLETHHSRYPSVWMEILQ